jgi:PEP-CTERM motif
MKIRFSAIIALASGSGTLVIRQPFLRLASIFHRGDNLHGRRHTDTRQLLSLTASLVGALVGASTATPSLAAPPAALGDVSLFVGGDDNSFTPGSPPNAYSNSISVAGEGAASGAGQFNPSPALTASAFATGFYNSGSYVFLQYYFEAVGPTDVDVPLILTASAWVSQSTVSTGNRASVAVYTDTGQEIFSDEACTNAFAVSCDGFTSSFSVAAPLTLGSNTAGFIALDLGVVASTVSSGNVDATDYQSGYIDPIVTIDPTFALANEFTLEFSPGVGDLASGVPEPSTWALALLGFAGIGYMALLRRKTVTAAAG